LSGKKCTYRQERDRAKKKEGKDPSAYPSKKQQKGFKKEKSSFPKITIRINRPPPPSQRGEGGRGRLPEEAGKISRGGYKEEESKSCKKGKKRASLHSLLIEGRKHVFSTF